LPSPRANRCPMIFSPCGSGLRRFGLCCPRLVFRPSSRRSNCGAVYRCWH